jgi:hypothetical protein
MMKVKSKALVFSNQASVRRWLEHGTGQGLLRQLTDAKVAKAVEHLTSKIEEQRLLQRQSVVVVLEPDGQLRDVYGTDNVSIVVRAMLDVDESMALEAEETLVETLPYGIRKSVKVFMSNGLVRSWPLLNQKAEDEIIRRTKLLYLHMLRDGSWKELLDTEECDVPI